MHRCGQIAPRQFVFALRPRFDPLQPVGDGPIDRLIVAQFEMQAGIGLDTAPIPAKQRIPPDKVQSPRYSARTVKGQTQQRIAAHRVVQLIKKGAGQVGRAPFAAAGKRAMR